MKVGDLIRIQTPFSHGYGNIGIVMHLWDNGDADVLFHDGDYQMDSDDLEVINESR